MQTDLEVKNESNYLEHQLKELSKSIRDLEDFLDDLDKNVNDLLIWKSSIKRYVKHSNPIVKQSKCSTLKLRVCLILAFTIATPIWHFFLKEERIKVLNVFGYLVLLLGVYHSISV